MCLTKERFIKSPFKVYLMDRNTMRSGATFRSAKQQAASNKQQIFFLTSMFIPYIIGPCLHKEFMQSYSKQIGTLPGHHNQPGGPATERNI